ncbi:17108_t:CDS:2 [Dentiscutata heterogama]|uniref:17108_t:CDS:1 n=1 Tax=Dentiscutata heterogama TaxID=1316150 RepID=A0ACA9LI46_9GLOM|nr:17108_t:CDS:2 [Dentiscutata heterogama]
MEAAAISATLAILQKFSTKQKIRVSINNKHADCSLEFIQYYYTGKCVTAPESIANSSGKYTSAFEGMLDTEGMICYNITKPSFELDRFYYLLVSWKAQFGKTNEFCVQLSTEKLPENKEEKMNFFKMRHTPNPQSPGYIFKWPKEGETPKVKFMFTATLTDSNDCEINVSFRDFTNYESDHYATRLNNPQYLTMINKTVSSRTAVAAEVINNTKNLLNVDLCFVLDCTGSMEKYINAARKSIRELIKSMNKVNPKIKIWFGFCGYHDYNNNDNLQILEFTYSQKEFENFVTSVRAKGGDNVSEDVLGGLNKAIKMKWVHDTRILIHIGYAPPHGARFNEPGTRDNYPNGYSNRLSAENVLGEMKSKKINYFFGKVAEKTDKMLNIFRKIIGDFKMFDLKATGQNPDHLTNILREETFLAISQTVVSTRNRKNTYLPRYNNNEPNWYKLTIKNATLSSYTPLRFLDEIKNDKYIIKQNCKSNNISFKIASQPFASGAEKDVYYALGVNNQPYSQMVMKKYKNNEIDRRYLESVEISSIAQFLSDKFNSVAEKCNIKKKIEFLQVFFLKDGKQCYNVEQKIERFVRFNSNIGIIVKYCPVLEAFAHFTYEFTDGYLYVCDLQGIELDDRFILTDPAIHCVNPFKFGKTNFGEKAIKEYFLECHTCNYVCKKLKLSNPDNYNIDLM